MPAVVRYRVVLANGTVLFPNLPGSVDATAVAIAYEKSHNTTLISLEVMN